MKKLIIAGVIFTSALCGCSDGELASTTLSTSGIPSTTPTSVATPTTQGVPYKVLSSSYEITEMGDVWWTFTYKVTIGNDADRSMSVDMMIQFLDSDYHEMAVENLLGISLQPGERKTITGTVKVAAEIGPDLSVISAGFIL